MSLMRVPVLLRQRAGIGALTLAIIILVTALGANSGPRVDQAAAQRMTIAGPSNAAGANPQASGTL